MRLKIFSFTLLALTATAAGCSTDLAGGGPLLGGDPLGSGMADGGVGEPGSSGGGNLPGNTGPGFVPSGPAGPGEVPTGNGDNCNQDVDVVFVLDVSGSMVSPLTFVQEEVAAVNAALLTKNLPSPPHFGLVVFVDDVVVMNNGEPYADINAFQAEVGNEITLSGLVTRQANAPESNLSWPENSLDALHAAATQFNWRPADTTLRTVIHLTDASFWDLERRSSADGGDPNGFEEPNDSGCTANYLSFASAGQPCTLTYSVNTYDQTIQALRDAEIWVNTFAAKTGGPPQPLGLYPLSHGTFRGTEVNVGIGFHEPYDGRNSIAVSTGGLSWDIDEVFDGVISLADPINSSIEDRQCIEYAPPPPPPDII